MSDIASRMVDRDLATIFTNCFPNTLDTTVESFVEEPLSTFVITGRFDLLSFAVSMLAVIIAKFFPFFSTGCALVVSHSIDLFLL